MEHSESHRVVSRLAHMRLNIDFSSKRPRASIRSLLLPIGALLALTGAAWRSFERVEEIQRIDHRLKVARSATTHVRVVLSPAGTEAINRAIRQLNLPWEHLFGEIEMRLNSQVALLSLEPDATNRILRIQGEAKSPEDMLDFVNALREPAFLRNATLTRHEVNEADRNRPIRFVVEAQWRPE